MAQQKRLKDQIEELLNSNDFDYDEAVDIYLKHGPNKSLARHFARNPRRYKGKLRWELFKMIGGTIEEFNGKKNVSNQRKFPPIINRIKEDLPALYNQRAELHKELVELGEDNSEETQEKAAQLGQQIDMLAYRHEALHRAKEDFFEKGIIPKEKDLYPESVKPDDPDPYGLKEKNPKEIMKRRSNLVSGITKDKNLLKYQSTKKLDEENPMPEGEERKKVEGRLKEKEDEIKAIDNFFKEPDSDENPEQE